MRDDLLYGVHALHHLLEVASDRVLEIFVLKDKMDPRIQALLETAASLDIPVHDVQKKQLDTWFENAVHQGVAARFRPKLPLDEHDLAELIQKAKNPLILVLDNVQDPHNLGACFRVADAAGATCIVAPKDNSATLTPIVRKVSSGASETVPFVQVTNLARALEIMKKEGVWLMGLAGEATQSVYEMDFKGAIALVLGAEGSGLRRLTRESCDHLLSIPMLGAIESLNVSNAATVCLFEAVRQRLNGV